MLSGVIHPEYAVRDVDALVRVERHDDPLNMTRVLPNEGCDTLGVLVRRGNRQRPSRVEVILRINDEERWSGLCRVG